MINRKSLSRNPLSFALATAMVFAASAPVFAQDSTTSTETKEEAAAKKKATDLGTVTVTGSRISRDVFNSVSPVQVVTREETTLAGFNSTASALQSNSVTAGSSQINNSFGGYVTNGGPGANTLSLRGLGATRTLILLNGRRVAPAGSRGSVGSADLNVLPSAMVDRVEILKDGASSIYGSDAVAGVVNIITRKNVDGVEVEFQHNATESGGGDETRYSLVFGNTGERSHFSGSYENYRRNEMTVGDRGWASCPMDRLRDMDVGNYFGSGDYIDPTTGKSKCFTLDSGGVTINTLGTATFGGANRWRPNPAVTTGRLPGYEAVGYYDRDTFDPGLLKESLVSPAETHTLFFQGGVDLGVMGDAEFYYEFLGNKRKSTQTGYRQLSYDYSVGNPLLGNLSNLPAFALPSETTNGQNVAARTFIGFGNDRSKQTVDFFRATAGVRGSLGSEWNYDFMVSHADSDADYTFNSFLTNRLAQSLNVVSDGAGGFSCVDPSNGCVAAPMLNAQTLAGNLPVAWKNFVYTPVTGNTTYKESTANLNVNGPLFDMPGGTAAGAFGIEYRKAKIDDTPNPNSISRNLYSLTSSDPTRGSDSVWEAYGEIELPLLSGVTAAEELTFNASARYTDYKSYGDDTTYKIGGLWTPVKWLSFRASYGTSYRAPALFEQYLGATSGFLAASSDPCNNYGSRNPTTPRYINCASEGLPTSFTATNSVRVDSIGGGLVGANLKAETSTAKTIGMVVQPEFGSGFGDLSFAVDYYDIEVENGVAQMGAAYILSTCYNGTTGDFAANNGVCRLISRAANNTLTVQNGYANLATDKVRGLDFTTRYVRDIGPGEFRTNIQISRFLEQSGKVFEDDPLVDSNGLINNPKFTGQLDLSYKFKEWRVRYGLNWVDDMSSYAYYEEDPATSAYDLAVPNYITQDFSVQYTADKWQATAGVRNFADKEPPTISPGAGVYNTIGNSPLYSGYDYFGRTFFVNLSKKF